MTITGVEIPVSVVPGTGTYTIPANMYGIVTVFCQSANGGDAVFTINGTQVIHTTPYFSETSVGVFTQTAGSAVTATYKLPAGTVIDATSTTSSANATWSVSLFNA